MDQEDEEPRGKFQLSGKFEPQPVSNQKKPAFDFAKAYKEIVKVQQGDPKAAEQNQELNKEAKVFVNKNLFVNSAIRPLPLREQPLAEDKPTPKLVDDTPDLEEVLVRENLLSSSKALKYKDQVANPKAPDSPLKSLFDYEENKAFKQEQPAKPQLFENPFK